jgi:hypothetical protein
MQLCAVYARLGEPWFGEMVRSISMGRLRTYQLFESFKVAAHLHKLNTEILRKAAPRFWARISEGDEAFAKDLGQAVLVSHLDMIGAILDFLGIPNENGFFSKDIDPKPYLSEGWQGRVYERFRTTYKEPVLLFYINHLGWELEQTAEPYVPTAPETAA